MSQPETPDFELSRGGQPQYRAHPPRDLRPPEQRVGRGSFAATLTGAATGFVVRYGLRTAFSLAAAHVTVPATIAGLAALPAVGAFALPVLAGAVIGGFAKLATIAATGSDRRAGWRVRAFVKGAGFGLLGGIGGTVIGEFVRVQPLVDFMISHHWFAPQQIIPVKLPVAKLVKLPPLKLVPPLVLPPMLDPAIRQDINGLLRSGMLARYPALRKLGERALQSGNAKAVTHFCKEASYRLINGRRFGPHARVLGKKFIHDGLNVARTFNLQDRMVRQLDRDQAYLQLHGLYGQPRDISSAIDYAHRAGRIGHRFAAYGQKLLHAPAPG